MLLNKENEKEEKDTLTYNNINEMNITVNTYSGKMVGAMVGIYKQLTLTNKQRWGKVKLKEDAELYMDVQTGELSIKNPEPDMEWAMYKSTSTDKVAYYCERKGEWQGPEKPTEEDQRISVSESEGENTAMGKRIGSKNSWEGNRYWEEMRLGDVRALHSFRRHKTVFQGDLEKAEHMLDILDELAEQEERRQVRAKCAKRNGRTEGARKIWSKVKQSRNEPSNNFLATMEILERGNPETPEEREK